MLKFIELNEEKQPTTSFDINYTSMDNLDNAGMLLNNKVIVVDFDNDNKNESEIIDYFKQHYPTLTVKTTRGIHFYYSKPDNLIIKNGADKITIGGFQADYKTGTRSYAIVKHKGKLREASEELKLTGLPELPILMHPLLKAKNITGLGDGDGRNNSLFYHLRLIREQKKELDITSVGNFINDVILADKLNKKELETLIDSVANIEVNSNGNYNGDPKDMVAFAEFICKELDVKRYNHVAYIKNESIYTYDEDILQRQANKYLKLRKNQFMELKHQLVNYAEMIKEDTVFKIKLKNGVIEDDMVVDYDCGFTPFYLNVNYDPNTYDKNVDDFLNFICCNRKEMRIVLEEILGHVLMTRRYPAHLFFLTGNGANGKSTFVNMLNNFTGSLSSNIDISKFGDGTCLLELKDKLVNIADDIDNTFISKAKYLKTLASGDKISERAIYGKPTKMINTATLLFTANEVPDFKDKTGGNKRRILIIPFDNEVKKRNPKLIELLSSDNAKSYLLNLGLKGITRIISNGYKLSESKTIKEATEKYRLDKDSVASYLNEYNDIAGKPKVTVYEQYQEYCEDNELLAVSSKTFTTRLGLFGYKVEPRCILGNSTRTIIYK
ncbi:MAG: phage/plasmid primase, P4 family [Bacilli bacterium]